MFVLLGACICIYMYLCLAGVMTLNSDNHPVTADYSPHLYLGRKK